MKEVNRNSKKINQGQKHNYPREEENFWVGRKFIEAGRQLAVGRKNWSRKKN